MQTARDDLRRNGFQEHPTDTRFNKALAARPVEAQGHSQRSNIPTSRNSGYSESSSSIATPSSATRERWLPSSCSAMG
jgi:hypothetical protein